MKKILRLLDLIGLIIIIPALVTYSVRSVWNTFLTIMVVIGVALILAGLIAKYEEISATFRRRSVLMSMNFFFFMVLLVGVLSLINFLGQRYEKRFDMTKAKTFSLSDQTASVLKGLQKNVHIKAFFPRGDYRPVRDLLVEFKSRSKKIDYEFIDPDKYPQVAKKYEIRVYGEVPNPFTGLVYSYGTLVLEMDGRTEKVEKQREELQEEDLTNALLKVTKEGAKVVYFLTGHGEKSVEDRDKEGYSIPKEVLQKERYEVKTLNLAQEKKIPENAAVLIINGPTREPFAEEIKLMDEYLNRGGSLFILLDPPPAAGLKPLLKNWSVEVGDNLVVDRLSRVFGGGPTIPLVARYGKHKITEKLNNIMTFYPLARSVSPAPDSNSSVSVEKLVETNSFPDSWAITDLKSETIKFDANKDLKGPVSIGVVATKNLDAKESTKDKESAAKKGRLVVFGDSDFAENAYFVQQGNGDLFLNVVNWLAQEESLISIRPKNPQDRRIVLSEAQKRILAYSIFLIPATILIVGIAVWVRRRR